MAAVFGDISDYRSHGYLPSPRVSKSSTHSQSSNSSRVNSPGLPTPAATPTILTPVMSAMTSPEAELVASTTTTATLFQEFSSFIPTNQKHTFSTVVKLTNMVEKRIKQCLNSGTGCYMLVTCVSEEILDKIHTTFSHRGIRRTARFHYEPQLESLILKLMPCLAHEGTAAHVIEVITDHIKSIPGHTRHSYVSVGTADFRAPTGRIKQGDQGLKPPIHGSDDFPSFVVEVGYSESIRYLRLDAKWWLLNSHGATKMVLIVEITKDPPYMKLESWKMEHNPSTKMTRNHPPSIPTRAQYFNIDAGWNIIPPGVDLIIPYNNIFDVVPTGTDATDITISSSELSEMAAHIFQHCL